MEFPNTGMPRVRRITDAELNALVVFVRSLGRARVAAAAGNPANGKAVYRGSSAAPPATPSRARAAASAPSSPTSARFRAPDYLRQAIVDPAATLPRGVMPVPGRGFHEFLPVRVVTRDGQEVRGIRVNEDSFTIQVQDTSNRLYSFRKADLQTLDKEIGQSMMPNYSGKVSGSELDDLVAYLWSLRGAK